MLSMFVPAYCTQSMLQTSITFFFDNDIEHCLLVYHIFKLLFCETVFWLDVKIRLMEGVVTYTSL